MTNHAERITKLDAAKRQLKTAIQLFLEERDPVSIHTLTEASREILRTLLRKKGDISKLEQVERDRIKPEYWRDFRKAIDEAKNFFKHADRNPSGTLEFRPAYTAYLLFECVLMYRQYTGRDLLLGWVFGMWFLHENPDLLQEGPQTDTIRKHLRRLARYTKADFAQLCDNLLVEEMFPNMDA